MSLRGLLVLIVALAVVVGVLVWAGKKPPAEPPPAEKAPLVAKFTEADVTALTASCGTHAWTLTRTPAGWRTGAREADPRRVRDVIVAVQDAHVSKIVEDGAFDRKAYALEPGCALDVALTGRGKRSVRLGRTSPVGAERYTLLGDGRLALTDGSLYGMIDRDEGALEERRLFPVESPAVSRITALGPQGRIAVESGDAGWKVVAPFADRGSEAACSRLAAALTTLAVDEGSTGTKPPIGPRIVFELAATGAAPKRADVAAEAKDGKRAAWREDGSLAGTVADATVKEIDLLPDAYREKRIALFSAPDVRSVRLDRGPLHLEATHAEGAAAWKSDFDVDSARVDALVENLRGLTASGFVAGAAPPSPATGTIVVRDEKADLARLTWGSLAPEPGAPGESVWVESADRPGVVFRVPATALGPIPTKASDWAAAPKGK
ncbi:MAG TPA: DUF4340 domain-containing protein [Candidatus Polarisedimenticolaceae bacterium]|nr:DUF4340 domain-containing protein [Candidatus Polarisedimenticolaceae bacterium]